MDAGKALKSLGIAVLIICGIGACMNMCDDTPKFTDVEIGQIPEGTKIENVTTDEEVFDGRFIVNGQFVNERKTKLEIQQITVKMYDADGKLIAEPFTTSGLSEFIKPGERCYWTLSEITKRPAKIVVSANGIWE